MAGAGATLAADGMWISGHTLRADGLSSRLTPAWHFDVYPCALCRKRERKCVTVSDTPPGLLLTDDFSRAASPDGSGHHWESQPGPPAHYPVSLVQLFREMLHGAPDLGLLFASLQGSQNPEGHVYRFKYKRMRRESWEGLGHLEGVQLDSLVETRK